MAKGAECLNVCSFGVYLNGELRIFGDFNRIGEYVGELVANAHSEKTLLSTLVKNWSVSYDYKGNMMAEKTLTLLATLDYGLDEKDILDFLGKKWYNKWVRKLLTF